MKTLKELQQELDNPIPRSAVKQREGAGKQSFSYLSTDYVIARMNALFGNLNWSTETVEMRLVHEGEIEAYGKKKHTVHYIARVKVEGQYIDEATKLVIRATHMGTGYGDGSDTSNRGKAHEMAAKEAESDALKRACKNLGQSMGLALYDKDQPNVEDDVKPSSVPAELKKPFADDAKDFVKHEPRPSAKGQHDSRPQGAPTNREALNKNISSISKIAMAKGKATQADLEAELQKYGAGKKEDLSDADAQKLFDSLKALVG